MGSLFSEHVRFHERGGSWLTCDRAFCLRDLPKKNALNHARAFFTETEVRAFFQHVQGDAEIHQKGGSGLVVNLAKILSHPCGTPKRV